MIAQEPIRRIASGVPRARQHPPRGRQVSTLHVEMREHARDLGAIGLLLEEGLEEGDAVEVLAGVEAGEQVVVAGQGGLKAGAKLKVI